MNIEPVKINCGIVGTDFLSSEYRSLGQSLDSLIMPNYVATFIGRVSGDSMEGVGIFDGDLLIVDRALQVEDGDIIVATYNCEFVCKILDYKNRRLLSASDKFKPVLIDECDDFSFEGVVSSSVRLFRSKEGMRSKLF